MATRVSVDGEVVGGGMHSLRGLGLSTTGEASALPVEHPTATELAATAPAVEVPNDNGFGLGELALVVSLAVLVGYMFRESGDRP